MPRRGGGPRSREAERSRAAAATGSGLPVKAVYRPEDLAKYEAGLRKAGVPE